MSSRPTYHPSRPRPARISRSASSGRRRCLRGCSAHDLSPPCRLLWVTMAQAFTTPSPRRADTRRPHHQRRPFADPDPPHRPQPAAGIAPLDHAGLLVQDSGEHQPAAGAKRPCCAPAMRQSGPARIFARMMSKGRRAPGAPVSLRDDGGNRDGGRLLIRAFAAAVRTATGSLSAARTRPGAPSGPKPEMADPHPMSSTAGAARAASQDRLKRRRHPLSSDAFPIRRPAPPRQEAAGLPPAAAPRHARHRPRSGRCGAAGRRPGSRQASRVRQAARHRPRGDAGGGK